MEPNIGVSPAEGMGLRIAKAAVQPIRASFLCLAIMLSLLAWPSVASAAAAICEPWVAKLVSVQGNVQVRRAGETQWQPVRLDEIYCAGDMIRVQEHSRAAVVLRNEINLRLDQNTTITFIGLEQERTSLLDLLSRGGLFLQPDSAQLEGDDAICKRRRGRHGILRQGRARSSLPVDIRGACGGRESSR